VSCSIDPRGESPGGCSYGGEGVYDDGQSGSPADLAAGRRLKLQVFRSGGLAKATGIAHGPSIQGGRP